MKDTVHITLSYNGQTHTEEFEVGNPEDLYSSMLDCSRSCLPPLVSVTASEIEEARYCRALRYDDYEG